MQAALEAQLAGLPATAENGTALYKFLFENAPQVKGFFKGDEEIDPSAIPGNPRYEKLGKEFIERLGGLVGICEKDAEFNKAVNDMAVAHKDNYNVTVEQFKLIPEILIGFLGSLGVTADPAWHDFWKKFLDAATL